MYPKYQLLTEYFQISNSELYKNLYIELQNMYPDIDLNQIIDDYCYKNNLDSAYTLDVIERDTTLRSLFEDMVDNLLERYNLIPNESVFIDDNKNNIETGNSMGIISKKVEPDDYYSIIKIIKEFNLIQGEI